ncbi:nucleoside-binding protein [Selenomonas ruminantium]|uniref:Nucleoside-binding protein n=1 Tax=Selenomonas ruminantium TaxID=971 RepID=A0A1M6R1Z9_SELRU|nr:BMP family ABC transporter substrate-binding protein [Selenomonas ruminantium]SHK26531.1 nucleoside-binding protein [Selenomonas ruminantium]
MNSRAWKQSRIPLLLVAFMVMAIIGVIQSFRLPSEERQVTVGVILASSLADRGWNEGHYSSLLHACQGHGCRLILREFVPEKQSELHTAVEELIQDGAQAIFLTSFGYGNYVSGLADRYPGVAFFSISGKGNAKNSTYYFSRLYQARYLAGIVAGAASRTGVLGFVAGMPNPQTNRNINAYAKGIRRANPEAKLIVHFIGSWDDEQKERKSVASMAAEGADVITYHTDKPYAIREAEARNLFSTGYDAQYEQYSERFLTAALYDWDVVYEKVLGDYLSGRVNMSQGYWLDMEEKGVRLSELSPLVSEQTKALVDAEYQRIRREGVFTGVIYDNKGRLRCDEGERISDRQLFNGMEWFVEGVAVHD